MVCGTSGNNAKRPTSNRVGAQIMCMVGHGEIKARLLQKVEVEKTLEVFRNPLLSEISFVGEEFFQCLAHLWFNSGTHQRDVDGDIGGDRKSTRLNSSHVS